MLWSRCGLSSCEPVAKAKCLVSRAGGTKGKPGQWPRGARGLVLAVQGFICKDVGQQSFWERADRTCFQLCRPCSLYRKYSTAKKQLLCRWCGCVPIQRFTNTEVHINFYVSQNIMLLILFQPLKNVKALLSLQAAQRQMAGWI